MKRFLFLLLLTFLGGSQLAIAANPGFLLFDAGRETVEVMSDDCRSAATFEAGPRPAKLVTLPDRQGFALLYRGSGKIFDIGNKPGGIIMLDGDYRPTGKKVELPGLVINESYLNRNGWWIIFTTGQSGSEQSPILNIINLETAAHRQISLESIPSAFAVYGEKELAVTLLGNQERKLQPQLVLINLTDFKTRTFPVGFNPGAIFFIDENRLLVACGGFRESMKYPEKILMETAPKAVPATVNLIDAAASQVESIPAGYPPLTVVQDPRQPETFYIAGVNDAYPDKPSGSLWILRKNTVSAALKVAAEPVNLFPTASGNLCLLGREELYLIDPAAEKIIKELKLELKTQSFQISREGAFGYLSPQNSSYLHKIDLTTGAYQKIKIAQAGLLGTFSIGNPFPDPFPPVTGMEPVRQVALNNAASDQKMFFSADYQNLFVLSGRSEVSVVDLNTNRTDQKLKFKGKAFGIHPVPSGKYIVASTDTYWHLLSAERTNPILSVPILPAVQDGPGPLPLVGYYSPDGKRLIIPYEKNLYVIDTENAKYLGKFKTKVWNPVVIWAEND